MAHPAASHASDPTGAVQSGFLHPFSGLDHLLVMVAVGLWAVAIGGRALWLLPCSFVGSMMLGWVAGTGHAPQPVIEHGIAASLLLLGAALSVAWKPSLSVSLPLVLLCGAFHGFAHGSEMSPGSLPLLFLAGMASATALLHAGGVAGGLLFRENRLQPCLRIAGLILIGFSVIKLAVA